MGVKKKVFRRGRWAYVTQYPHAKGKDWFWTWGNHCQALPIDANFIHESSSCQVRYSSWWCCLISLPLFGEACLNTWASTRAPIKCLLPTMCPVLGKNCFLTVPPILQIFWIFQQFPGIAEDGNTWGFVGQSLTCSRQQHWRQAKRGGGSPSQNGSYMVGRENLFGRSNVHPYKFPCQFWTLLALPQHLNKAESVDWDPSLAL